MTVLSSGISMAVLVVGPSAVADAVQGACEQSVDRVDDALAGLERVAGRAFGTVFVWAAGLPSRADAAVAAMREVLPGGARLLLIARPDEEPLARRLAEASADDYLIWPLQKREVVRAMGLAAPEPAEAGQGGEDQRPGPVLGRLGEALSSADTDLSACLDRVAALVAAHMQARGCTVELPEVLSVCGEAIGEPALAVEMDLGEVRGRLAVGPRRTGVYGPADVAALEAFGSIVGTVARLAVQADHWRHKALTDELTGLLNRRGLLLKLPAILERARRQRTPVTLLVFDIDDFKHYNDAYGHSAGDEILRETSRLFERHCRRHDLVTRYGGDEFVVVFWEADEPRVAGSKPPRDVPGVLARFRKSLERHEFPSLGPEATGALTISGGLITYPWDAASMEQLIDKADEALLRVKRQGKNRIWLVGQGPA